MRDFDKRNFFKTAGVFVGVSLITPISRANGDPLNVGDMYFNEKDKTTKIFDGKNWKYLVTDNVLFSSYLNKNISRVLTEKLNDIVSVKDFGAVGDGKIDDTIAIQRALDSGHSVDFSGGVYRVSTLYQTKSNQALVSLSGTAIFMKNSNGPMMLSSADGVCCENIRWLGGEYNGQFSGDGVVFKGNHVTLVNCGGQWMDGVCLTALGSHLRIHGTNQVYQSNPKLDKNGKDISYDIVIGSNEKTTLYHELIGIITSQKTGGILLLNVGSHTIVGGQFGKLSILRTPDKLKGINGGKTIGARILGDVYVGQSNSIFSANQFGEIDFVFESDTSGSTLDASNIFANGFSIKNKDKSSNYIQRYIPSQKKVLFGDDVDSLYFMPDFYAKKWTFEGVVYSSKGIGQQTDDHQYYELIKISGKTKTISLGADTKKNASLNVYSPGQGINYYIADIHSFAMTPNGLDPVGSKKQLGSFNNPWHMMYSTLGAVQVNAKSEIMKSSKINEAVLRAWGKVDFLQYQIKAPTIDEQKIWHFGVLVEKVKEAFESEGLNPFEFGILAYEKPLRAGAKANYGLRYSEALILECAYIRSLLQGKA